MKRRPRRRAIADHMLDQLQRAGLVGLQRQAEAAPLRMLARHLAGQRLEHVQRQLQPVHFLGIDGQADVGTGRALAQGPDARHQLGQHPLALRLFIARMQRAELDRDAVVVLDQALRLGAARRWPRCRAGSWPGSAARRRRCARLRPACRRRTSGRPPPARRSALAALRAASASRMASLMSCPSTNWRPSNCTARSVAATTVRAPSWPSRPASCCAWGSSFLDMAMALCDKRASAPSASWSKSARPSWSAVSAMAVWRIGHPQQRLGQPHQGQPLGAGDRIFLQQPFHRPERRRRPAYRLHPGSGGGGRRRPIERAVQGLQLAGDDVGLGPVRKGQALGSGHGTRIRMSNAVIVARFLVNFTLNSAFLAE